MNEFSKKSVNFSGEFNYVPKGNKFAPKIESIKPNETKLRDSLKKAIIKSGLKDKMTISFHHHFRNGDHLLLKVVEIISDLGIKNLILAPSSLTTNQESLVKYIKNGVIDEIHTSGVRGKLASYISKGGLDKPIRIRSHGGRARAIESGDLKIDVSFLAVPSSDKYGNSNTLKGKTNCGSLGYAKIDANYAKHVIVVTDTLEKYPNFPASISQKNVNQVVVIDKIGDDEKIASGATRFTKNPKELLMAKNVCKVIKQTSLFKDGFSFQTGSGGASLAVARFLKNEMIENDIKASFVLGGITKPMVQMHKQGLIDTLLDVQSFDLTAAKSISKDNRHFEIDASLYANPHNRGNIVNKLDIVILSALEIDLNFNVNVITGSNGHIMGASGGHSDTAACADLTIIVAPLIRGRIPTVVKKVNNIITPGSSIDILVTDRGIAVNPKNKNLLNKLKSTNLKINTIEELQNEAKKFCGEGKKIKYKDNIVGVIEYRDGTIIDIIKEVVDE